MTRRIAAIMTVFNRKEDTLRCLRSLATQDAGGVELSVFVVDDASTDGTASAVEAEFPHIRLIRGDGDLYWNGGMRLGYEAALAEGFDFYWWLNDDVELDGDALARLLHAAELLEERRQWPGILVGSMRHPEDGQVAYGGVARHSRWRRFQFSLIEPHEVDPVPALTMNGNCVLIPKAVAHDVGNISADYRQKMGDFDYGLRAQQKDYPVWVAPGTYGTCATHPGRRTDEQPLIHELRRLWSVKELPPAAWMTFVRRWGGLLWPIYFLSPYLNRFLRLIAERLPPDRRG